MKFKAAIEIIGINPFVALPEKLLAALINKSGKERGPIPVAGTINDVPYKQTLVKYKGIYRLYINTTMLKNSPSRIGEKISLTIDFDVEPRIIKSHPDFIKQLNKSRKAKKVFDSLPAHRQLEINRYINKLKTEESRKKNIEKAIQFLLGKERFVGREEP